MTLVAMVATAIVVGSAPAVAGGDKHDDDRKVIVCKYVGRPDTDERLQTGQNPIVVSERAIQNQWDGTMPGYFSDRHGRSYVLAYATDGTEYDVSDCPQPDLPEVPDPKVEYTEWVDSEWECGDLTVIQSRTLTTTPFKVVNGEVVEDTSNVTVTTETRTRTLTEGEVEGCKPEIPSPEVTYGEWTDGEWTCNDTTVTQTRTVTTTPYKRVLKDGQWTIVVDSDNIVVSVETQTRPLTEDEVESCKPSIPDPTVSYTEWVDQRWECGDAEVTQTRTKMTTPFKVVPLDGQWAVVEDADNVTVTTETQTRPLTEGEIESCVVVTPTPTPTPTPSTTPPATPANNPLTPNAGGPIRPPVAEASLPPVLAATGQDSNAMVGLAVAALLLLLGGTAAGVIAHRMRQPVPVEKKNEEEL